MSISLPEALNSAKIPNPLLLIGARREHAIALCKRLLQGPSAYKIDSGNHPDLHLIEPEGKGRLHPVAAIHAVTAEMELPPFEASSKVFILFEADRMLPPAANALLKTLEEPASDSWLILLTDHPDHLLPTVLSRLSPVHFEVESLKTFDVGDLLLCAQKKEWDTLLWHLDTLNEEDSAALLKALLESAAQWKDPLRFFQFAHRVEEGRRALEFNIKLRVVAFNLLLQYHRPNSN